MSDRREPPVQFRDKEVEDALRARAQHGESPGATARRELARHYATLARDLAGVALARGEAMALLDVLNGTLLEEATIPFLWAEVADALEDGLAETWGIDGPALVARVRALTPGQTLAVVDAVERWWNLPPEERDRVPESLRAVGLLR